jgi:5-methylcytosine-specific restriction endonuclease McrA
MSPRDQSQNDYDRRRAKVPWRRWYSTRRWRIRRAIQLKTEPLCRMCKAMGKSRAADTVDHIIPHRGDPLKFWYGALQSLCEDCHSREKQREELKGFSRDIGDDGWPTDPRHIFNRTKPAGDGGSG